MSFPRIDGYVIVSKIGSGSYSTVYKAYCKTGARPTLAIKCVDKSRLRSTAGGVDNLLTEIRLLKSLRHPRIIHMHDFLWDDKRIYIAMEYCTTDLSSFIRRSGRLPEPTVLYFLQQLVDALRFLREQGVAHMDLKPQNLLLNKSSDGNYSLKVADFGFAQYMSDDTIQSNIRGSPLYMAPEMLTEGSAGYGPAVDLWSMGVIMYECLFGQAPYRSATFKELIDKILGRQPIEFPANIPISSGCADLLTRLLQHDPARRITHGELFQHEYLDLEHMPSPENYDKAVGLMRRAVEADRRKRCDEAFELYRASLRYLVPVVNAETDPVRRSALRAKVAQYMQRAEWLKTLLSSGGEVPPAPPARAPPRAFAVAACCGVGAHSAHHADPIVVRGKQVSDLCICTKDQASTNNSVKLTNCSCEGLSDYSNTDKSNTVQENSDNQNTVQQNMDKLNTAENNCDRQCTVKHNIQNMVIESEGRRKLGISNTGRRNTVAGNIAQENTDSEMKVQKYRDEDLPNLSNETPPATEDDSVGERGADVKQKKFKFAETQEVCRVQ